MNSQIISASDFSKQITKTVFLFKNTWKENTTALLHSPRETDKCATAIDIALTLADKGREILYVNTERNIEDHADRLKSSSDIYIFTPGYQSPDDRTDYADLVINGIEEVIATTNIRTFIIDSVTRIAALSFGRNASAAYIMKRLVALQVRCGASFLIIAHDMTRATDRALINLADCEIALQSDKQDNKPADQAAEISDHKADSVSSDKCQALPLTRQQRRAIEREQRKLARRAASKA